MSACIWCNEESFVAGFVSFLGQRAQIIRSSFKLDARLIYVFNRFGFVMTKIPAVPTALFQHIRRVQVTEFPACYQFLGPHLASCQVTRVSS